MCKNGNGPVTYTIWTGDTKSSVFLNWREFSLLKETEKISVLNYNENRVSVVVSPDKSYSFDPSSDGVTPTVIPMTIDEIKYANNSSAFKTGLLFFDKNKEKDIYELLNIPDWENILSNHNIQEILLHPTYEGLNRIISIKDSSTFERVRSAYQKLVAEGVHDISVRVEQIIKTRYKELLNKQVTTSIVLTKKDVPEQIASDEVNELKAQNEAMQKQMAQMQALIEKMMETQKNNKTVSTEAESKKSPGRPKKNAE